MNFHATRRRGIALAAAAVVALPVLAACGSDDDSDASGDTTSGDTIKVMVYGPFDAQGFSINGVKTGAQAGVEKVNAEGGINGRKLELIACTDDNNPNTAAACARQAVAEDVVAVVGGLTTQETQILPTLEKAGIPVIGNFPVADFTSSNTYPFVGGGAGAIFGIGKIAAENPVCEKKASIVQEEFNATTGVNDLITLGVTASGGTIEQIGKAPQGSADFAPAVQSAVDGAGCVIVNAAPQTSPQILTALAEGVTFAGAADSQVPGAVVAALGEAAEGFTVANEFLPLNDSTDTEGMKEFLERSRAIDPDFDPEGGAASAYVAPLVLKAAIEGAGVEDITPETITKALDELSGFDSGLGATVDFTKKNPTKAFSRLPVGGLLKVWVAQGGQYVLDESVEPISIDAIYEAAASAGQ